MIHEVIVTTTKPDGGVHLAPLGIRRVDEHIIIAPLRPSTTLENLLRTGRAVLNYTDDVRVFAGCVTGRNQWPLVASERVPVPRLAGALAHTEIRLVEVEDDPLRPRLTCLPVWEGNHRAYPGFNRAQAAVLELAILVTRLDRLPHDKVSREISYLRDAVEKTGGERELEAWSWLMEQVEAHEITVAPSL